MKQVKGLEPYEREGTGEINDVFAVLGKALCGSQ
jgi:hypothetical protein